MSSTFIALTCTAFKADPVDVITVPLIAPKPDDCGGGLNVGVGLGGGVGNGVGVGVNEGVGEGITGGSVVEGGLGFGVGLNVGKAVGSGSLTFEVSPLPPWPHAVRTIRHNEKRKSIIFMFNCHYYN